MKAPKKWFTVLAMTGLIPFSGCDKNPANPDKGVNTPPPDSGRPCLVIIGTNYVESNLSVLNPDSSSAWTDLMTFSGDAVVNAFQNVIYVLDRTNATLTRLSQYPFDTTKVDYQVSVGNGSNPYAIVGVSTVKAYVIRYGSDSLLVINPATGAILKYINLEAYEASTHTDTLPNTCGMSCGLIAGNRLFVACQRLEAWMPADTSLLVVINTTTDSVEKAISLVLRNPQEMRYYNGRIYLACAGAYFILDGGIEAVNVSTLQSEGVVISDQDVSGDVGGLVIANGNKGYAAVGRVSSDFKTYWTEIRPFNPSAKTVSAKLDYIENGFGGLAYDSNLVYVGERGTAPGIVVVNPINDSKVKGPISTGLPPFNMSVVEIR